MQTKTKGRRREEGEDAKRKREIRNIEKGKKRKSAAPKEKIKKEMQKRMGK